MNWKSIDESPALSRSARKASTWIAEAVVAAAVLLACAWPDAKLPGTNALPVTAPSPAVDAKLPGIIASEPKSTDLPGTNALPATVPSPADHAERPGTIVMSEPIHEKLPGTNTLPPEPLPAAVDEYRREWKAAMARASRRDLDGAAVLLRRAGRATSEVRSEAARDLEDLDRLRSLEERAAVRFAGLQRGKVVDFGRTDGSRISGEIRSAHPERLDLRSGLFVEFCDLEWSSLTGFDDGDLRTRALALLLDGRRGEALHLLEGNRASFDEKHWELPRVREAVVLDPMEREARAILYDAERLYRSPATRMKAVDAYRLLQAEFVSTSLVRRSLDRITARSKAPGEFYFAAADLSGRGRFRLEPDAWKSQGDVDFLQARHSFVEAEFEAEPGISYRAFVRLSGCCAERLKVYAQASGLERPHPRQAGVKLAVEPGSIYAALLKRPDVGMPPNHVDGHPVHVGWTEIPLTASSQGGTRRFRLLTDRDGVGVSGLLLSSTRAAAPSEAEQAALEASRGVE